MSASVRLFSLSPMKVVFSFVQAFFASLSAIDFNLLLWYTFFTDLGEC